jgi:hypothetical protein
LPVEQPARTPRSDIGPQRHAIAIAERARLGERAVQFRRFRIAEYRNVATRPRERQNHLPPKTASAAGDERHPMMQ